MTWSCRAALALALLSVSCNSARPERAPLSEAQGAESKGSESKDARCQRLPFADSVPVAEASGAAALTIDGRAAVLVVGDSGTNGAYVLVDATTGDVIESGQLPLGDGAGDDLEGLAASGDTVWGVTSAGWMRRWTRTAGGFTLVDGPYPVGDGAMSCDAHGVNCGKNYEALCLAAGGCAGWLGSKTDGALWCLVESDGRLVADPARSIDVTGPEALAGCDTDPRTGAIYVGTNLFGGGAVYRVLDGAVSETDHFAEGFLEALLVLPDEGGAVILHRYSDIMGAPSPVDRWRCP